MFRLLILVLNCIYRSRMEEVAIVTSSSHSPSAANKRKRKNPSPEKVGQRFTIKYIEI